MSGREEVMQKNSENNQSHSLCVNRSSQFRSDTEKMTLLPQQNVLLI